MSISEEMLPPKLSTTLHVIGSHAMQKITSNISVKKSISLQKRTAVSKYNKVHGQKLQSYFLRASLQSLGHGHGHVSYSLTARQGWKPLLMQKTCTIS